MFNKFTEKSQEAIINAQAIAANFGQPNIEAVHILLSLLQQPESLVKPVLEKLSVDPDVLESYTINEIKKLPKTKVDLQSGPIQAVSGTNETALILERSKKEADGMGDEFISTEHILLALIGIPSPAQNILLNFNVEHVKVSAILQELRGSERITDASSEGRYKVLEKYTTNLTELARQEKLDPVVGRDTEVRRVMQVLLRRTKNNPVLIG